MPLTEAQFVPASDHLLPRVLHDLAQPFTALECALEVALRQEGSTDFYRQTLEKTLETTHSMSEQLLHVRDLCGALEDNDDSQLVNPCDAVAAAVHEVEGLAESLGSHITVNFKPIFLHLKPRKLQFAMVRLLDWLLQAGLPARVRFQSEEIILGDLRLSVTTPQRREASPRALESASTALSVMGGGVKVFVGKDKAFATVSIRSFCHLEEGDSSSDGVF